MTIVLELENQDLDEFVRTAAQYGTERFGYVVTPNVDHIIRFHDEPAFREMYADAEFRLCDSRFLSRVLSVTKGVRIPVCTGSDLTRLVISRIVGPTDVVVLVGASDQQAEALVKTFGLKNLRHINPPMGFIRNPAEVQKVLEFVERHSPFRFCLLAIGCPQQESVAQHLKSRGRARGLALCIGASVDFLTDKERRAPAVLQRAGLEWAFRLMQNPRRLAYRYLVRGPRIFRVLRRMEIRLSAR